LDDVDVDIRLDNAEDSSQHTYRNSGLSQSPFEKRGSATTSISPPLSPKPFELAPGTKVKPRQKLNATAKTENSLEHKTFKGMKVADMIAQIQKQKQEQDEHGMKNVNTLGQKTYQILIPGFGFENCKFARE